MPTVEPTVDARQHTRDQLQKIEEPLLNDREFKRELVALIQDRKIAGNPISTRV
jgi:hypothetical protein